MVSLSASRWRLYSEKRYLLHGGYHIHNNHDMVPVTRGDCIQSKGLTQNGCRVTFPLQSGIMVLFIIIINNCLKWLRDSVLRNFALRCRVNPSHSVLRIMVVFLKTVQRSGIFSAAYGTCTVHYKERLNLIDKTKAYPCKQADPMLDYCWSTVCAAGPTSTNIDSMSCACWDKYEPQMHNTIIWRNLGTDFVLFGKALCLLKHAYTCKINKSILSRTFKMATIEEHSSNG